MDAEVKAAPHEIKIIEHQIEEFEETVKVLARLDDAEEVVSDALITGLKKLNEDDSNGIVFEGTKMDWGRDNQDFVLLFFSVDMMNDCE